MKFGRCAGLQQDKTSKTEMNATVVGELTSGVLHSLNNRLQSIIGLSELLISNPEIPEEALLDAKSILDIASDASEIVKALKSAAKTQPDIPEKEDIPAKTFHTKSRSSINILVSEDDPMVLRVVVGMLKALGFSAIATMDGQEALEKYLENPSSYSVIIADLDMPRLGGLMLAEEVLKKYPDAKVVVMTGYIHQELGIDPDEFGLAGWLEKPMTAARLEQVIEGIVGS
jgi:CheY-like chemotaxis protein